VAAEFTDAAETAPGEGAGPKPRPSSSRKIQVELWLA